MTDGRGKKPAFQFIGPDVSGMTLTEEEKKQMPATRQKNSLLAVGRNLVLGDADKPEQAASVKRARSLSEERPGPVKLVRTRSESRVTEQVTAAASASAAASLFELSEVCEVERAKLSPAPEQETAGLMKPPTPGRPPSRKKHLLARYYSDSALLCTSAPRPVTKETAGASVSVTKVSAPDPAPAPSSGHSFTSPRPRVSGSRPQYSPAQINLVPPPSPRTHLYSPLHPSPLTKQPPATPTTAQAPEKQYTGLRSPVTPRDLRNSAILPPQSPQRSKLLSCSPMGPVGRSLLSSPASPRAPIDLSVPRPSARTSASLGRSPLASRSLNLPPTPPASSPGLLQPGPSLHAEHSSPLLRAYLANNKHRIFKPILATEAGLDTEQGVAVLPPDSVTLSPATSVSAASLTNSPSSSMLSSPPPTSSPDGSSASSSASELEGIFGGKPLPRPTVTIAKNPRPLEDSKVTSGSAADTPLDFSGLLSAPPAVASPFSILSLTSPFLNNPRDLTTPHIELAASPSLQPPQVPAKKYSEVSVKCMEQFVDRDRYCSSTTTTPSDILPSSITRV